jgi:hypothetical protein
MENCQIFYLNSYLFFEDCESFFINKEKEGNIGDFMKNMICLVLFASLLVLGCTQVEPYQNIDQSKNITIQNNTKNTTVQLVKVHKTGPIESYSVAATYDGSIWKFSLTDYSLADNSNPFSDGAGGNIGKTSTAYIRINESELAFLAPYNYCGIGEYQSMWVTPKISINGKGSIFEAVYLAELKGDTMCRTKNQRVVLLGKEYEVLGMNPPSGSAAGKAIRGGSIQIREVNGRVQSDITDGKGFGGDDRWKTVLGWKGGKLEKIIIYMDGYFYDVEENDQIVSLFGTGNRVLAGFSDLNSNPKFNLITTNMAGAGSG